MIPISDIEMLIKTLKSKIPKQSLHNINTYYDGRNYGEIKAYGESISELKKLLKKYKN